MVVALVGIDEQWRCEVMYIYVLKRINKNHCSQGTMVF